MKTQTIQQKIAALIKSDPIALMFVHDALIKQTEAVLENEEATLLAMQKSFVAGPAWVRAAKDVRAAINA
jgi:hypothetical protein